MKFARVIGKIDPDLVEKAEKKLSKTFLDLGLRYTNETYGSKLGGDPLIFSLLYPVEHVCTMNISTAATDGKRYYWNPKFILKLSPIGLRIVCAHEAWHAIYMHPQRRGLRLPKLWNIAVDYIVNGTIMDDFKTRKKNPEELFVSNLGKYLTLEQYAKILQDPFSAQNGTNPLSGTKNSNVKMPKPDENRELTAEEIKELERRSSNELYFYADPNLAEDMKKPERIYDYLYKLLPKCSTCGSVGVYKNPKKNNKPQSENEKKDSSHTHDDGQPCNCPHHCDECGGGLDIFDFGDTVDDHMDAGETEEKMAKRIAGAMDAARKMAGYVPGSLEEELGKLTAPKISWQDIIRSRLLKARNGNGRNDWTRFRSRPMFSGQLVPKRKNYYAHFGCLLDTSGSMSKNDIAFGLSQLISLDEKSEGTVTCGDAEIYWDKSTKIARSNVEELSKIKIIGRGGTMFANYFSDYEKYIGVCDFLIVITDGYLLDTDIAAMKNPGIDVIWLLTSGSHFKPPFGRAFDLRDI